MVDVVADRGFSEMIQAWEDDIKQNKAGDLCKGTFNWADNPNGKVISEVLPVGNRVRSPDQILQHMRSRPGTRYEEATVQEDVRRLHGTKWFVPGGVQVLTKADPDGRVTILLYVTELTSTVQDVVYVALGVLLAVTAAIMLVQGGIELARTARTGLDVPAVVGCSTGSCSRSWSSSCSTPCRSRSASTRSSRSRSCSSRSSPR